MDRRRLRHRARRRVLGFTLIELMIAVAILAVLAAAAVPAFIRYTKRSRTVEAVFGIRRIFDGAVSYFATDYSDASGALISHTFPSTVATTPALTAIGGTKTLTEARVWHDNPSWSALHFAVTDPHHYAYQFDSRGTDNAAAFTVAAFGNLDSDAVFSTFVRFASVNQMNVVGGAGVYVANELE